MLKNMQQNEKEEKKPVTDVKTFYLVMEVGDKLHH